MVFCFAITLFLSAFLLFLIQPMVGKMVLPALGGTPAVWNTCMVFFQAALLAGYAYAHQSVAWLGSRRQAALQVVMLLVPLSVLPMMIDTSSVPAKDNPTLWLLWRLLVGVGLPFFVVSTSAPLLQRWFSETGHVAGRDPYFLYSASNLGSLLALFAYPTLVERMLPLAAQSQMWRWGYVLLIAMAVCCAVGVWRSPRGPALEAMNAAAQAAPGDGSSVSSADRLTVVRCLRWVALSFVPSSLMLGLTTYATTDLAPVPLLWVAPLALYLLTFVWVFARRRPIRHEVLVRVLPFAIAPTVMLTGFGDSRLMLVLLPLHMVTFFLVGLVCHGELAIDRPPASHLTQFYLLMSVGGVLGGVFNAVAAPLVFTSVTEYPLVMVLACMAAGRRGTCIHRVSVSTEAAPEGATRGCGEADLRERAEVHRPKNETLARYLDFGIPLLAGLGTASAAYMFVAARPWAKMSVPWMLLLAALCLLFRKRRLRFALTMGAVLLGLSACIEIRLPVSRLHKSRNFYGPKEVISGGGKQSFNTLRVGSTIHGMQWTDAERRGMPTTYYDRSGPAGDVFRACLLKPGGPPSHVAIIGLGGGAMAAYAVPGQHFTFYEIDPDIARIASDPGLFTFLQDCRGTVDVVLGDGRLTLGRAPDARYGLILIDAFSSDAIPTHLLTREALQLYLSKLEARGFLVFHVTNRYVSLPPLLAVLAQDAGLVCRHRDDLRIAPADLANGKVPSQYVVLARRAEDIGVLARDPNWREVLGTEGVAVWSDQYTNIFQLLKW